MSFVVFIITIFTLPEILNSGGLSLQQALKVKAGLGLVEEDHLHVDVVTGGVEEVGLKQVESLLNWPVL